MGTQTRRSRNTEKARKQAITIPGVTNIFRFNKLANGNTTVARGMNRNATTIELPLSLCALLVRGRFLRVPPAHPEPPAAAAELARSTAEP